MKKIVYFLLVALCLPIGLMAQSVDDDLYFVPSKQKQERITTPEKKDQKRSVTTNIYTSPGTTVVVHDRNGKKRDVDEYNRRYDARNNDFVMENDTLYINEKEQPDLDGEWVNGEFNGTQDDYEYAERIIRFRNPRFAISISSPLYWDVVYGPNSWDWNIYTDGMYAYAFPTFSNPLWWDWRYNSYGWGWNNGWGWNRPYYSWGDYPGSWGGWYGSYWGGWYGGAHWGHHHWNSGGYGGGSYWARNSYTNRRSVPINRYSSSTRSYRSTMQSRRSSRTINTSRRSSSNSGGRVVGTRYNTRRTGTDVREVPSSRRSTYTRPSSTRSTYYDRGNNVRSRRASSNSAPSTSRRSSETTYNRGSSTSPSRNYDYNRSTRSRTSNSYSSPRSTNRSSSNSNYSSGSSSRSSSSRSYSSGSSRSGGGSSSTRSGRR